MNNNVAFRSDTSEKSPAPSHINTTALAFIGDAVFEIYVREHVLRKGQIRVDKMHRDAVSYVKAGSQAMVIKSMFDDLTAEEQRLVKRARNHKSASKPKNADPVDYKWATAFEALIGYLHLSGSRERMEEIILTAIHMIDNNRY